MRGRGEWRQAFSAMGSAAGIGFGSGRAFALFFAQMGGAAWTGMALACALFGLILAACAYRRQTFGTREREGGAAALLRLAAAALAMVVMLVRTGGIGALTLPVRHGYLWGAAMALLMALALNRNAGAWMPALGVMAVTGAALFYAGMAMDARPVRIYEYGLTDLSLAGSRGWAIAMAVPFAAMAGCAASWAIKPSPGDGRPARVGALGAGMLFGLMALEKAAIDRGGAAILPQPMPWVILSARWGLAGFWLCAAFEYLCCVCTLTGAVGALYELLARGRTTRAAAAFALLAAALLFAVLSSGEAAL